mgnify:CR=1 FL=1
MKIIGIDGYNSFLGKNFIKKDDSEMVLLDEDLNHEIIMNSEFSCGKNYLSLYSIYKALKL